MANWIASPKKDVKAAYGLGENMLSMLTGTVAQPVSGLAALWAAANGQDASAARDAVAQSLTYAPKSAVGQAQQAMLGDLVSRAMQSAPVKTWQQGVDIAGRYSPAAGAALQTVPTAIGVAMGAKPALAAGRALSDAMVDAQAQMAKNAMAPRTLNRGAFGQRGAVGVVDDDLQPPGTVRLYHGSYEKEPFEIKPGEGIFGGIFTSPRKGAYGSHDYYVDIPEDSILTHSALDYEIPYKTSAPLVEKITGVSRKSRHFKTVFDAITESGDAHDPSTWSDYDEVVPGSYLDVMQKKGHFRYGDDVAENATDASFDLQRMRGQLARELGYDAVHMKDDTGISTLVLKQMMLKSAKGK